MSTAFVDPAAFATLYPQIPGVVRHNLADHALFTLDALVALASRLPPLKIEYNRGDLPIGIEFDAVPRNGLSVTETIRGIETNGSWMVLKFVEQDPAYRDLLVTALAELDGPIRATTGPMLKQEAFIFISSPNSVTPLHFDPEHNILLQLRGSKVMTVFAPDDCDIAPALAHERFYHGEQHRNLSWDDKFAPRGHQFTLTAGDGIYVPLMAPHWVQNGPDVSISFSVTWRTAHSYRTADAHGMNARFRKAGIDPAPPKPYPARNLAKSFSYRALRKVGSLFSADDSA
jgi:Cupin-like domain